MQYLVVVSLDLLFNYFGISFVFLVIIIFFGGRRGFVANGILCTQRSKETCAEREGGGGEREREIVCVCELNTRHLSSIPCTNALIWSMARCALSRLRRQVQALFLAVPQDASTYFNRDGKLFDHAPAFTSSSTRLLRSSRELLYYNLDLAPSRSTNRSFFVNEGRKKHERCAMLSNSKGADGHGKESAS